MFLEIISGAAAVGLVWFILKKDPEPLLGVYSQPGKWFPLKKLLFFIFMTLRKYKAKSKASTKTNVSSDSGGPGYGVKSRSSYDEMDCPQILSSDEDAVDCMYFNGLDSKGTYVIFRIARRHGRKAEIWLSVNVPGVGFFQSPIHPDTTVYNVDNETYSAGGLKFECLEPMSRWKITYNGLMRKGMSSEWSQEPFETVHIQISLMWCAFTDPFDFDTDIHPSCIATAVAREKWSKDFFERLRKTHQTHYEQWGELWGTFNCEEHPEVNLRVRGYRDHSYGVRDWHTFHRYAINFAYLEDGSAFHVNSLSMPGALSLLQCGYFSMPNAILSPVSWTDMDMIKLNEDRNPPKEYEFNFKAGGKKYHVRVVPHTVFLYYLHEDWRSVIFEQVSSYEVNGVKGYGIFEFLYRHPRGSPVKYPMLYPSLKEPKAVDCTDEKALALVFSRPGCASSKLVGGKGCQLALLDQLSSEVFSVPDGFCLTLRAFDAQMKSCDAIQQAVLELQNVSCNSPSELQLACSAAVSAFKKAPLCAEVSSVLVEHLIQVFGAGFADVPLAVRSSASGEDGTEMSAAGQMETVLGVKGLEKVSEAICSCWSSQFAFPAVSYRRQHGQPIIMSAGVVIQQMVPAAAAGVLFTCHPVSGNPGIMVLNANYGLGESVVSGQSQPDEILISRSWDDKLEIKSKSLGSKKLQIKLSDVGGTEEVTGGGDNAQVCCLSDNIILQLAAIGVELEKRFSNPRDIEFAVDKKNKIYLLQARPVTAMDQESEYYLMHEFDTALCHNRECVTCANVQEMMPGAMTPLTICTFLRSVELAAQMSWLKEGFHPTLHQPYKFLVVFRNQAFINLSATMCICNTHSAIGDKRMCELALVGYTLPELTLDDVKSYNGSSPLWKRLANAFRTIQRLRKAHNKSSWWTEQLKTITIADHVHATAADVYADITQHLPLVNLVWDHHMKISSLGTMWTSVVMSIVTKNEYVWSSEHFSDVAILLSKCNNVVSADVPTALQELTKTIIDSGFKETFAKMSVEDGVTWLKSAESGPVGTAFAEFMRQHGHRCIREAELRESSWQTEPAKIVKVLQSIIHSPSHPDTKMSNQNSVPVDKIKAKLSFTGRFMLDWVLPKAWSGVGNREFSKSQAIRLTEVFKVAYRKLAAMMVKECYLPDEDLIFFLTHREIGQVLEMRSGRLIARAQKRRQMLAKQMSLRFPHVFFGHPNPINENPVNSDHVSSLKFKGLPVSQGEVTGRARVVTSLELAAEIQNGEILIVPYTDIGWSPYFPLISGLVTEIGGLISHGAVVAREYGLPCVVNIPGATVLFKSGDMVLLNGTTGTLEKLN